MWKLRLCKLLAPMEVGLGSEWVPGEIIFSPSVSLPVNGSQFVSLLFRSIGFIFLALESSILGMEFMRRNLGASGVLQGRDKRSARLENVWLGFR